MLYANYGNPVNREFPESLHDCDRRELIACGERQEAGSMTSEAASYHEDVERLRQRFVEFRQAHAVRSRLPEELWTAATKLARRDGITATARALGVDRPSLQKWTDRLEPHRSIEARKPRRRQPQGAPAFVELLTGSTATASSCVVEVESRSGCKLRLDLKAIATSQLAELIRAFAAS
jgi:hypothetical protein